jgi:uncharacterized membrane protein YeaQ/YmgE (transglycosylase-associated protein family)
MTSSDEPLDSPEEIDMNWIDLLLTALVAIVCGILAQLTSRYSRGGWIVNLALGFLGAMAGVIAARILHAPKVYDLEVGVGAGATEFPIMYAIIGSVFFLAAIGLFVKPGR